MNFDVTGLDLSPHHAKFIKEELGLTIINSSLESYSPNGTFDFLWLSHIIEHTSTPREFLKHALAILSDDGIIAIQTPLTDDHGIEQHKYRDIYHVSFFDPFSLSLLATQLGLSCVGGFFSYRSVSANVINFTLNFEKKNVTGSIDTFPSHGLLGYLRAAYNVDHKEMLRLGRHYIGTMNPSFLERFARFYALNGMYTTVVESMRSVLRYLRS
jgi:SAM-dependent methyltransferase